MQLENNKEERPDITWQWYTFEQLTTKNLYKILKLRQEIFIVEQHCPYLDCDNLDLTSWHLLAWSENHGNQEIVAYLRVIPRMGKDLPRIGRVLTHSKIRHRGLGRQLMETALLFIQHTYPQSPIQISAQEYLTEFYRKIGFQTISEIYKEDNIPHRDMIYVPAAQDHDKTR